MVYTDTMEYNSALKKKNEIILITTTWMDLEDVMLSAISQKETDKYCMISSVQSLSRVRLFVTP